MRSVFLFVLFSFYSIAGFSGKKIEKTIEAIRITETPKIDGILDELCWHNASFGSDFIQSASKPGENATQRTEVRVVYDDRAIYIGAVMYDVSSDSILRELTQRDNEGNSDLFAVFLDTYNDNINAFGFGVTPGGVQLDARYSDQGEDFSWNAVWKSEVYIGEKNWSVEFMIPYSALRFSANNMQIWGINIMRKIRRIREESWWNFQDPEVDGFANQFGLLTGLNNIEVPLRLSFTPYISSTFETNSEFTGSDQNNYSLNGGLDVKYGINEAFTLDMTLIPDFSQVQSDNQVLNLSPFEVFFSENRPFFLEGTELFNKGGWFYSRRVGGRPVNYFQVEDDLASGEEVVDNPVEAQLFNASKLSGRTNGKMGVGLFNAVSDRTFATVKDSLGNKRKALTGPFTNYNVIVLDQALKNNSFVSLVNTSVIRNGSFYDANLTGTEFRFRDSENNFEVSGSAAVSQKYFSNIDSTSLGFESGLSLGKISGNWLYEIGANILSHKYDPNDLGFRTRNNSIDFSAVGNYNIYKPVGNKLGIYSRLEMIYRRIYDINEFSDFGIFGNFRTGFSKNWLWTGSWFGLEPIETYDYFEPRVKGKFLAYPRSWSGGYWISTDYRKRFAIDSEVTFRDFEQFERYNFSISVSPRFRFSDQFTLTYNFYRGLRHNDVGYVDNTGDSVTMGIRTITTYISTLNGRYVFTNRMALTVRLRHYWSTALYKSYHHLSDDGYLKNSDYTEDSDRNFNAFTVDMIYSWQFAPGSEMNIVWKNSISPDDQIIETRYFDNLDRTLRSPQINNFSIKVLYYLDYAYFKRVNNSQKNM